MTSSRLTQSREVVAAVDSVVEEEKRHFCVDQEVQVAVVDVTPLRVEKLRRRFVCDAEKVLKSIFKGNFKSVRVLCS